MQTLQKAKAEEQILGENRRIKRGCVAMGQVEDQASCLSECETRRKAATVEGKSCFLLQRL